MQTLSFTLHCTPTAQARPRHMRTAGGIDITYKAASQKANERTLEALLAEHRPDFPFEGGLELSFKAVMPLPKTGSQKKKRQMLEGKIGHTVKPDLDNLCKNLTDAMTRLRFWHDDKQIVRVLMEKAYGNEPCWIVGLTAICEEKNPQRVYAQG